MLQHLIAVAGLALLCGGLVLAQLWMARWEASGRRSDGGECEVAACERGTGRCGCAGFGDRAGILGCRRLGEGPLRPI